MKACGVEGTNQACGVEGTNQCLVAFTSQSIHYICHFTFTEQAKVCYSNLDTFASD